MLEGLNESGGLAELKDKWLSGKCVMPDWDLSRITMRLSPVRTQIYYKDRTAPVNGTYSEYNIRIKKRKQRVSYASSGCRINYFHILLYCWIMVQWLV